MERQPWMMQSWIRQQTEDTEHWADDDIVGKYFRNTKKDLFSLIENEIRELKTYSRSTEGTVRYEINVFEKGNLHLGRFSNSMWIDYDGGFYPEKVAEEIRQLIRGKRLRKILLLYKGYYHHSSAQEFLLEIHVY